MASSGQITVYTESVDWPNYSRGACTLTNVVGWSVDDSANISFQSISSSDNVGGTWGVCTTGNGHLIMTVQVNYGSGWVDLVSKSIPRATCPNLTNAITASITLIGMLGSAHLSGDCTMRILYYADLNPHPSESLPNAFPSESYSEAVQVPVHVDVPWTATLTYNANGGSGAPATQTQSTTQSSVTFTVANDTPTWGLYQFLGWSRTRYTDSRTEADVEYRAGDTITLQESSPTVVLYAVWRKDYRPGATLSGVWLGHERTGGKCHIYNGSTFEEMRTIGGDVNQMGTPPSVYHDGKWYNQHRRGKE